MALRWRGSTGERPLTLREAMDRLFEDSIVGRGTTGAGGAGAWPALDLYETGDDYVLTATLPGVTPEDVEITVAEGTVHLRGQVRRDEKIEEDQYLYRERSFGAFSRSISLPAGVQADQADASFEDGILRLRLPKAEELKPRRIQIRGGEKQAIPVEGGESQQGGGESPTQRSESGSAQR